MITRAHLIGELSPGHAAPRWPMARGRPGRRAGEPGHDHAAHVPDVGEHPARGRARDTGGSRGPPDRRAGAALPVYAGEHEPALDVGEHDRELGPGPPGHELSTRRQAGAGPLDAGEHEPEPTLADAGKHEAGPGRRRARAGAGTGHTAHLDAELGAGTAGRRRARSRAGSRGPWTRAEHTPASGSRAHAPGPRTSASWEPGQLVSAAHPVAELAHDHAAHCARRRRPPT
jgi:hypothetical protein